MSKQQMKKYDLEKTKLDTPFRVPEGYFDKLTGDIQHRISADSKKSPIWTPKLRWALAVSAAMIVFLAFWFIPSQTTSTPEELLASVSEDALLDYIELSDFTYEELLDGLDQEFVGSLWSEEDVLEPIDLESLDSDELLLLEFETDI